MYKKYIYGTILIVLATIIFVAFVEPKRERVSLLNDFIKKREQELLGKEGFLKELDAIKKSFSQEIENVNKINIFLPKEPNIADLLVELDNLTYRNGLLLKDISFSQPTFVKVKGSSGFHEVVVDLSVSGTYESLLNFNDSIKSNRHLMDVKRIEILSLNDLSQNNSDLLENQNNIVPTFNYKVKVSAYYQ